VFGVRTFAPGGLEVVPVTTAIDLDSGAHIDRTRALPPQDVAHLGGLNAGHHWRVWLTRRPLAGAVIAGLVAGQITTVFGIWFHGIGLPDLDWPIANGAVVDPKASVAVQFSIGEFIHGIDCIVFALIFALFVFPLLGKIVTPAANMAKAIFFGLVLATLSAGFLVPYVYFPHAGAGVFGSGYGWKLVFAIYLWHFIFGVNLGMMYNPLPLDDPSFQR
jgi:hypothetical protein